MDRSIDDMCNSFRKIKVMTHSMIKIGRFGESINRDYVGQYSNGYTAKVETLSTRFEIS